MKVEDKNIGRFNDPSVVIIKKKPKGNKPKEKEKPTG